MQTPGTVEFAFCAVVGFIAVFAVISAIAGAGNWSSLVKNGLPARGILLSVNSTATAAPSSITNRLERRTVDLDVELPGQAPYVVTCAVLMPVNLRSVVLPGATVELRVDPKKRDVIAIVGPGVGVPFAPFLAPPPGAVPLPGGKS